MHPCNEKPCPIDCHWGSWTQWTQCTRTGRKRRRRSADAEADAEADADPDAQERVGYKQPPPPIHPVAAPHPAPYHVDTGICTQSRHRIVEVPAAHYGKECKGEYSEDRFCQSYECPGM